VRVVDRRELVQVDDENAGERLRPLGPLRSVLDPLVEQHAVGQPGQRVVQRRAARLVGVITGLLQGLRAEQVRRRDVGERLRDGELAGVRQHSRSGEEVESA
jgi:hypothetical protein